MSEGIGSLSCALSKAQALIKNVTKDKSGYNYKYADLASCLDVIKEPFAQNGLAISQIIAVEDGEQVLHTMLIHESNQWLKSTFILKSEGTKSTNDMQAFGSGVSYARRYALTAIAGLAQEDDDGATSKYMPVAKPTPKTEPRASVAQAVKPAGENSDNIIGLFKKQCLDSGLDLGEFAKFHKIESKNLDSVKEAIKNFDTLKRLYEDYTNDLGRKMKDAGFPSHKDFPTPGVLIKAIEVAEQN